MHTQMAPSPTLFVPVAAGSRGRRGLHLAKTARLVELLDRYRGLRDGPGTTPELQAYCRSILGEIRDELNRRAERMAAA